MIANSDNKMSDLLMCETSYKNFINKYPLLSKRITLTEDELEEILIQEFGENSGYSRSSLSKARIEGKGLSYIQLQERGRVLYPLIFIYEEINQITIANKFDFVKNQLLDIFGKNRLSVNQNTLSRVLGIGAPCLLNWLNHKLTPNFFLDINSKKMFKIDEVVKWILKNSIHTSKYQNEDLERRIN